MPTFKSIRVAVLLVFLTVAGLMTAHQNIYSRNWSSRLEAVILPINADGHIATNDYIKTLSTRQFSQIDRWFNREARRHDLLISEPVRVTLGSQVFDLPPKFPENDNGLYVLFWGLRFRWWAYRNTPTSNSGLTQIRLFVMYHEGTDNEPLAHSLGMQKGLLGLVHVFAVPEQSEQNNIIIAHEMLHTVGAADKYEQFGNPIFPVGYANAARTPLFPQRSAEIMAGRIPTSYGTSYMAESLKSVVINRHTALEINWLE